MKPQSEAKEVRPLIPGSVAKKVLFYGLLIGAGLIVTGLVKTLPLLKRMWHSTESNDGAVSSRKGTFPICADAKHLVPSRANRVVEWVAYHDCLADSVDLKALAFSDKFVVDYFGDAEIYGCIGDSARDCFLHTENTGVPNKPRRNYPDVFRVRGKNGPVQVRFRLTSAHRVVRQSSNVAKKKDSLAEEVERQYQEILEMQRRQALLKKKQELEKEKKKLEKKMKKFEKG